MTKTFIAASTALAIALGAFTAAAPAQAGPFGLNAAPQIQAVGSDIETVGNRGGRHKGGRRRGRHHNGGAAAAVIGLGALAFGAALAANAGPRHVRRDCFIERTKRWSRRHGAFVITKEKVCY